MNILHIGKYYPPFSGGIENFMGDLLPLIVSNEHKVCALVHDHSHRQLAKTEIIDGVEVIRVSCYGRLLYAPISPAFVFDLKTTIQNFKPDIIHIHMPNTSAFWLLLLAQAKKIPWVIHWHSDVIGSAPNKWVARAYHIYQFFERKLLQQSQAIIATSPHYLKSSPVLQKYCDKTHVIPLGLNQESMANINIDVNYAEKKWQDGKNHLLSIGRLTYYKGHQYLIKAMLELPDSQLIIIGQGEEYQALKNLIQDLGLQKRVTLTGKLEQAQLHGLLSTCDVFCLPSIERTEAFGLVLLEAMYYAKPTMVSHIMGSGMTWVCQDQQTGIHVQVQDSHDIARRLASLLLSNHIQRMGLNGKQKTNENFNIYSIAKQIIMLYQTKSLIIDNTS